MLSYRHSFHAGNFGDVLKHLVMVELITYLQRKPAPFDYIDTHAGAGLYRLGSAHSRKLLEHENGIGRIYHLDWPELAPYLALVKSFNRSEKLEVYPGSPLLALSLLRPEDRAWLYELHPEDVQRLGKNCSHTGKLKILGEDGFAALPGLLPPKTHRGLVLIDPSYEVKRDYTTVVEVLARAHRRFSGGIYTLWYPVVDRRQIDRLERGLTATGIRNIQRFELGPCVDGARPGMTSSGMIVINPTWGLFGKMEILLPKLAKRLGMEDGVYRCDVLAEE